MICDLADVFDILQLVIRSDDEDGSSVDAIKRPSFDQHAVVLAKRAVAVIAGRRNLVHARRAAPSLHREWKIHAYASDLHTGELGSFLVESFRFGVADRCIERRNAEKNPGLAGR